MDVTTVFFLLITITYAEIKCQIGWVIHESKCYKVNAELVTWFEARMKCKQNRSVLAVIRNEQDQKFLTDQIQQEVWIGLNDRQQEQKYVWLDQDLQVSPTYWKPGNPYNNILAAMFSENCVAMGYNIGKQDHGKWIDYPCAFKLGFVCQRLAGQEANTLTVTDLSPANSAGCAGGWTIFQGTNQCYKKGEDKLTWADAREACRAWNANLVPVRSLEEGQFLAGIAQNEQNVWIGISAIPGDHSTWLTVDRDTISFSNWGPGEPDNNHPESEHCALEKVARRTWHDVNCQRRESYICIKRDQPAPACSEGWIKNPATNACYRFEKTIKEWHEAESACQTRNSHLASITSEDEFNFVVGTARENQGLSKDFWIGLHDKTVENKWEWTDGTPFLWSKWQPDQPDDWHGSEDCAGVTRNNLFNVYFCTELNMFVCERQAIVSGSCDVGWEKDPNTGVCFKFGTEKKTWGNTRKACQKSGGDLANIKSPDQQLFIYRKNLILS